MSILCTSKHSFSKNEPNFWWVSIKQSYNISKNPLRIILLKWKSVEFQLPHYGIPQFSSNYSILDSENSKPFYWSIKETILHASCIYSLHDKFVSLFSHSKYTVVKKIILTHAKLVRFCFWCKSESFQVILFSFS